MSHWPDSKHGGGGGGGGEGRGSAPQGGDVSGAGSGGAIGGLIAAASAASSAWRRSASDGHGPLFASPEELGCDTRDSAGDFAQPDATVMARKIVARSDRMWMRALISGLTPELSRAAKRRRLGRIVRATPTMPRVLLHMRKVLHERPSLDAAGAVETRVVWALTPELSRAAKRRRLGRIVRPQTSTDSHVHT
jgi:hypothetical protein